MSNDIIEHTGEIIAIEDGMAKVRIVQTSACSECHAKGICGASDQKEKIIIAELRNDEYSIGDMVNVVGKKSLGMKAVLLAYVVPFIIIIVAMVVLGKFIKNELIVGTLSLATLVPYFIVMRLFKDQIAAKFKFYVTEI